MTSRKLTNLFLALAALVMMAMSALAADPGVAAAGNNVVSDQKAGSILIYNVYASSSTDPAKENTRINITNTDDVNAVFVHLFFVDGASCSVADSYVCLSKSQTTSILASDVDPDTKGYIVAVAVDKDGQPVNFNKLIGDEYIKLTSGHAANLGAEAIERIGAVVPGPIAADANGLATLTLDGGAGNYGQVPRVLALDSIASAKDSNDTLLVINRVGGSLQSGAGSVGSIFGILFDELETGYSYTFSSSACQVRSSLSDSFPRTTPRFTNVIPAGSTGWTKFWATGTNALLGAAINKNATTGAASFNGGHNLHKLTYQPTATITVPVFPAMCS